MPRGKGATLSKEFKKLLAALFFVLVSGVVIGAITYVVSLIPPTNLTIGRVTIDNRLIIGLISWASTIAVLLYAISKFGMRL